MARPKWATHSMGHEISSDDVAALKPFRDKHISQRTVPCPLHGAAAGEPCISRTGKKVAGCTVRRKIAIRKLNEVTE